MLCGVDPVLKTSLSTEVKDFSYETSHDLEINQRQDAVGRHFVRLVVQFGLVPCDRSHASRITEDVFNIDAKLGSIGFCGHG
ncbi:hypothetical protein H5410_060086 [Solanum commersonii]|uniref:Uncharacterized protein n=1 Tax=Solanum commersonii TaxID=4109 RepID=A0A9J5W4Y5_SOLCO|nr:hypothetical protein H5410_060086 [Solanum commersonii]